ncbi:MAG TPA: hypothetical protein VMX35_12320 [Acidobacteriota bacterium]|nr:hypothetical protein [Acidobacteriota bacterium]
MLSNTLIFLGLCLLIALLLFFLDHLLLWMERRGWIYYRRSKDAGGPGVGNAFLEVQSLLEPNKKELLEIRREEKSEQDDSGAPPKPGEEEDN